MKTNNRRTGKPSNKLSLDTFQFRLELFLSEELTLPLYTGDAYDEALAISTRWGRAAEKLGILANSLDERLWVFLLRERSQMMATLAAVQGMQKLLTDILIRKLRR